MKQTSEQYKKEMSFPFRGKWLIDIYTGLINELFQKTAEVKQISALSFLSENCNNYVFDNVTPDATIATFEQNLFKADGKSTFMDESHTNTDIHYYGLISEVISNSANAINFHVGFKSKNNIKGLNGLTLHFIDTYPTQFTIQVKESGKVVFDKVYYNDSYVFETTDKFSDNGDELVLIFQKMNGPNVRLRIQYVLFGVGLHFTNEDVLTSGGSYTSFMHPCSIELPNQTFNISIENYENRFDFDRQDSLINLMHPGQNVSVVIGYTKETGDIEYLPMGDVELESFNMNGSSMDIKAVDFLKNETEVIEFTDPTFFKADTTLYDVAQEVIKYIKNPTFEIIIDNSLKSIPIVFHQIKTNVKESLMMIASASRCVMEFVPNGLHIRRKEVQYVQLQSYSNFSVEWADNVVINSTPLTVYATFEKDKFKADGTTLYPTSKTNDIYKTGYVSDAISDGNGHIVEVPQYVTIKSKEAISPSRLLVYFNDITVETVNITTHYNDNQIEHMTFTDINSDTLDIIRDFKSFNSMNIQVTKIKEPYRRVYIQYVSFNEYFYNIPRELIHDNVPKGELLDNVRDIYVTYTYSTPDENGELSDIEDKVVIHCNDTGSDIEYNNPFITTQAVAQQVGQWLHSYYSQQIEYKFDWTGDPSLEAYDSIIIASNFIEGVPCQIESHDISFSNGGIMGKISARRRLDAMGKAKNKLESK